MVRALLDEDVDVRLRDHFGEGVEAVTVQYKGWKGVRNGDLLRAAAHEFDVLVTMDDHLPSQQNLSRFDLAVVILRPRSKALQDLIELMPEVRRSIAGARPGQAVRIFPPPHPAA
jgi:hypothetical protein